MKKSYRVKSAAHGRALDLKVGDVYEHEYHPDHEAALIAGAHLEVVVPSKPAEKKLKEED